MVVRSIDVEKLFHTEKMNMLIVAILFSHSLAKEYAVLFDPNIDIHTYEDVLQQLKLDINILYEYPGILRGFTAIINDSQLHKLIANPYIYSITLSEPVDLNC